MPNVRLRCSFPCRGVAAVLLFALTLLASGCAKSRPEPAAPLVGAWRSEIQFENGAFASIRDLQFMFVFNAGGTLTESSNYDGAPPVPPAYGAWRALGPDEYEARYEYFSTAPPADFDVIQKGGGWMPSGRGVFTERIVLSADGRTFTSSIRYEAFDAEGKPAEGGGDAKGRGTRMES